MRMKCIKCGLILVEILIVIIIMFVLLGVLIWMFFYVSGEIIKG